ncbi:recombinase family protein [Actinomyces naeslundii]|uniref:recombinase family protein n=1 Tax=Actinomyces naeslundii TaxID=1655 RepID=UPI00094CE800|nr:recombinase family protein [Actinomyces naeslundii]OLO84717.1 resolvase [Actinomyces naeslundii]OLO86773.1 resolvase [Actinomyces naeslundii]OMG11549.1 resolvase [Actinomyces naeslundii]
MGTGTDPFAAMAAQLTPKRAVSYIRVSTREQAQRGGSEEGFSLPAQREANKRKAQSMGALVVKEFADRGESARSANRPELQKMLAYLKEDGGIDYVIVHKLDRLARNRADDVEINRAFEQAGVRLVSTSENIDQTPGGMLLHGIMSSIAEFYSRNLANEVMKGMGEKARNGGTLGKAPLGYVNVRGRDEHGREVRTVELDEERAPLVRLAFTEYATGNWTARQLAEHLNNRGLTIPPTTRKPTNPVSVRLLQTLLRNPYYKGVISFQGVEYAGAHEPLVDAATWQTVQDILTAHTNGERQRMHNHHLKSTIVCGLCGARLLVQHSTSRASGTYHYFVCARRHRVHDCTFKAVLIDEVEARVAELYQQIRLSSDDRRDIERYLRAEFAHIQANRQQDIQRLTTRQQQLEDQRHKLLEAHYAGAIPLDLLKKEQEQLTSSILAIQRELDGYTADAALVEQHLTQALDLLEDCHRLYLAVPDRLKKLLNQVFFERILVNPAVDEDGRPIIPPPALQTSLRAGRRRGTSGQTAATQSGEKTVESATSSRGEGAESGGSAFQGGHGEAQLGLVHTVHRSTISIIDPASHTAVTAELASPFDQLCSQQLRRAAQQAVVGVASQQNATSDQATERREVDNPHGAAPSQTADCEVPTTRTPIHDVDGRRRCNSGNDSAPTPVTQAKGSYTELVVDPAGLEPTTDAV